MPDELRGLLVIIAICIPMGLLIGVALRIIAPKFCKAYTKFCLSGVWQLFLLGVIFFSLLAGSSYLNGQPYHAAYFVLFSSLELYCLCRYGSNMLTPELEKRIDESNPRILWPMDLSKH